MTHDRARSRLSGALGIVIGFLSIGAMDGWPFGGDLETAKAPAGLYEQDLVVLLLLALLVLLSSRNLFRGLFDRPAARAVTLWALLLLGWWGYTVLRTWIDTAVPFRHAVFFGRDFAYFPLLSIFMADALRDRRLRDWTLGTFVFLALLDGVLQTLATTGHGAVDGIVHANAFTQEGGFTRVYASSSDAVLVALFVCLAGVLLTRRPSLRWWSLLGLVIAVASVLAELTRAKYLGASAGIVGACLLWLWPRGEHRRRSSRGTLALVAAAVIIALALASGGPTVLGGAGRNIGHRLRSSITTALEPNAVGSTTATRESELTTLEQIVGSHETLGLGFLDPRNVWYAQTRGGSIRNSDLGIYNVIATMGIIGAVIYMLALVGVPLTILYRHAFHRVQLDDQWLGLAVLGWAISVGVSSLTLVTLFSPTGVVSAALMLGSGVVLLDGRAQTATTTAATPRSVLLLRAPGPETT